MSSSNRPARQQDVQVSVIEDYRDTVANADPQVVIDRRQVNVQLSTGTPIATGRLAWVRNTYPAKYNFAAKNWDSLEGAVTKKTMRGGRFFLFRFIILVALGVTLLCNIMSKDDKGLIAVSVILCVLYTALSIYNIYIYCRNGSLIHDRMIPIKDKHLKGSMNEFFTIPIHAHIQDTRLLGVLGTTSTAMIASIQQSHQNIDSLKIMVYTSSYLIYTRFPAEVIIHVIGFWIIFAIGIGIGSS